MTTADAADEWYRTMTRRYLGEGHEHVATDERIDELCRFYKDPWIAAKIIARVHAIDLPEWRA